MDLRSRFTELINNSLAPNTHKTYNIALGHFNNFKKDFPSVANWPLSVMDMLYFIAYLSRLDLSASTICTYISAIIYFHKVQGLGDPANSFLVHKTLEGLRRQGKSFDVRTPISLPLLTKLIKSLPSICSSSYEATLFSSAFSLAFFAFLRVSEYTAPSKNNVTNRSLLVSDIRINAVSMIVQIRCFKTDQRGVGYTLELHPISNNRDICPVTNMKSYLQMRPRCETSQLFTHYDGSPLTCYQLSAVLKKSLQFCNVNTGHYSSHCFRIGSASTFSALGIPQNQIMAWGRWKSNAVNTYIRIPSLSLPS